MPASTVAEPHRLAFRSSMAEEVFVGPVSHVTSPLSSEVRQICTFYAMGGCSRGSRCPYSHELTQTAPDGVDVSAGFYISGNVANYRKMVTPPSSEAPLADVSSPELAATLASAPTPSLGLSPTTRGASNALNPQARAFYAARHQESQPVAGAPPPVEAELRDKPTPSKKTVPASAAVDGESLTAERGEWSDRVGAPRNSSSSLPVSVSVMQLSRSGSGRSSPLRTDSNMSSVDGSLYTQHHVGALVPSPTCDVRVIPAAVQTFPRGSTTTTTTTTTTVEVGVRARTPMSRSAAQQAPSSASVSSLSTTSPTSTKESRKQSQIGVRVNLVTAVSGAASAAAGGLKYTLSQHSFLHSSAASADHVGAMDERASVSSRSAAAERGTVSPVPLAVETLRATPVQVAPAVAERRPITIAIRTPPSPASVTPPTPLSAQSASQPQARVGGLNFVPAPRSSSQQTPPPPRPQTQQSQPQVQPQVQPQAQSPPRQQSQPQQPRQSKQPEPSQPQHHQPAQQRQTPPASAVTGKVSVSVGVGANGHGTPAARSTGSAQTRTVAAQARSPVVTVGAPAVSSRKSFPLPTPSSQTATAHWVPAQSQQVVRAGPATLTATAVPAAGPPPQHVMLVSHPTQLCLHDGTAMVSAGEMVPQPQSVFFLQQSSAVTHPQTQHAGPTFVIAATNAPGHYALMPVNTVFSAPGPAAPPGGSVYVLDGGAIRCLTSVPVSQ